MPISIDKHCVPSKQLLESILGVKVKGRLMKAKMKKTNNINYVTTT